MLEAGTILVCAEGMQAVRSLKALYPDRIVLGRHQGRRRRLDPRRHVLLQRRRLDDRHLPAPRSPRCRPRSAEAKKREGRDVQIELTGSWSWEEAEAWRAVGLTQVVYHRGRDAQAAGQSWSDDDLAKIRRLAEMGFELSITGGLTIEDLPLFAGLVPVKVFIAGRAIRDAADPAAAARAFKAKIAELWG